MSLKLTSEEKEFLQGRRGADNRSERSFVKVSAEDVPVYIPAGHALTSNRRLAGPHNGSEQVEFIIGEMQRGGGAERHTHAGFDQMIYMLQGVLKATTPDRQDTLIAGDLALFVKGTEHEIQCESEMARFIVLYSPPCQRLE